MDYLLPDSVYRVLKWVGLIVLPALATLLGAVGTAWGWPHLTAIVTTVTAVGTFVGALVGVSQATATPTSAAISSR